MSDHKSTLLEEKENPINTKQALIEYKFHRWTELGITPKGNGCCSLRPTITIKLQINKLKSRRLAHHSELAQDITRIWEHKNQHF
jgi:hypothetical protein